MHPVYKPSSPELANPRIGGSNPNHQVKKSKQFGRPWQHCGVVSDGVVSGGVVGIMASMQRKMDQWQRIEEEARRAEESEAMQLAEVGGVAEGRVVVEARRESVVSRGSVLSQVMVTIAEEGEEEERKEGKGGRRKEGRRVSWGDKKTGWEECEELVIGGEGEEQAMALSNLEKPALESPPQWYKETEI